MNASGRAWIAFAFVLAVTSLAPGFAEAGFPDPANWTVPALIPMAGQDANGVADARGEVLIVARDLANNPMPGVRVTIDLSGCPDVRLCSDPYDPAAITDCVARTVSKFTDATGQVRFRIVGCSSGTPGAPGSPYNCAKIYGDGVLEASPSVAIYDLVGCDGVGPADLSAWLDDFFGSNNPARADYDGSGLMGPSDLTLWLNAFFASTSTFNCSNGGPCSP